MNNALYALGAILLDDLSDVKHFTNFAMHRIVDVILLERSFDISFPTVKDSTFGLPWHEPKSFSIKFKAGKAADYVRERIWANEQSIEELKDDGIILHITTCSEPELMAWVRSFGDEMEVLTES